jgi:23S rRNA pseudouridine955/2504/2580 synthase
MPIAGDMIYGAHWPLLSQIKKDFSQNKKGKEPPMIRRFALHAHALEFLGINRQGVSIHAEYAKDMKVLLRQLRKYDYRS